MSKSSPCVPGQTRAERAAIRHVWNNMIARCHDPANKRYVYYGGRGISVCDQWRNDFQAFLFDMGLRPPSFQVERVNNDGNYEPGNCRWASRTEQSRNKRNNLRIEIGGITKQVGEWADQIGVSPKIVRQRYARGWRGRKLLLGVKGGQPAWGPGERRTPQSQESNQRGAMKRRNGVKRKKGNCLRGVCFHRGKWIARVGVSKKYLWLGTFETEEAAHTAYLSAVERVNGATSMVADQ